jgi:hypothetical protein
MKTLTDKKQQPKIQAVANTVQKQSNRSAATFQIRNDSDAGITQRKLQTMANESVAVNQLKTYQLAKGDDTLPPIRSGAQSPMSSQAAPAQSSVPTLPPIPQAPTRTQRPTTVRTANHAYNMAHSSFPFWTNASAALRPQFLGGIPSESRETGNQIAPQIADYESKLRAEEQTYDGLMTASNGLRSASTAASVASTVMSATGVGAVVAPAVSTAGNIARIGAGTSRVAASEALAERPASPTHRAENLSALNAQEGTRDIASGAAGLTQLPGASTVAGVVMDQVMKDDRNSHMTEYVDGVRTANERTPRPPSSPRPQGASSPRSPKFQ